MEQHNNTTEKIIAAIDKQKVTPRPRAYFILRNAILWIPGILTTLLGAYTVAGILYGIIHPHWENRTYFAIPLLWVVSFCLFSIVTISLIRKTTSSGYRHSAEQLLLISVTVSVALGVVIYALTQDSLDNRMKTYYRYPTQQFYERNHRPLRIIN
jgi:hypothetical protein